MKGNKFIWGILCAGIFGFTSCGTMQHRERGEQPEFKCGTTTASSTIQRNLKKQNAQIEPNKTDLSNQIQIHELTAVETHSAPENIASNTEYFSSVSEKLLKPVSIVSILPNKKEQKQIKEYVVSKFHKTSDFKKRKGLSASDFLPVEGIISILAGLLGLVSGLQIFRLIFGITAIIFGIWGRFKRFNILAKIGFWLGVIDLAWWGINLVLAGIF